MKEESENGLRGNDWLRDRLGNGYKSMIQPVEMRRTLPMALHGGATSTTTEVWEMLGACRNGDLKRVFQLISHRRELSTCQFNYSPPLHFAVREGHLQMVSILIEQKAFDPAYKTYPFGDSLLTMAWAKKKGHSGLASDLVAAGAHAD